jgi:hypothetical protein
MMTSKMVGNFPAGTRVSLQNFKASAALSGS